MTDVDAETASEAISAFLLDIKRGKVRGRRPVAHRYLHLGLEFRRSAVTTGEIAQTVRRWAAKEPLVRRVYLFGSRARGDNRPDSDIDLAVVCRMDPRILAEVGGDYAQARMFFWDDYGPVWQAQIGRLFSLPVDLQVLDRDTTRRVRPGVKRDGIRIV